MSNKMMRAAVMDRPLSIAVQSVEIPRPKPDEALVRVRCIGVCGSDLHYYERGRIGRYVVTKPIILGHELAGDVVEVGSEVANVAAGDRVAVEPGVTCGRCAYCKSGRYNLCPDVVFMATPPVDGAWAEYITIRSDFLFKLPDTVSYEEGALLEPLSVGIHAMKRAQAGPGDRVFISGLGPIGLLAGAAAKLFGVTDITASEVIAERRGLAGRMGIDRVLDPSDADAFAAAMSEQGGYDVVVESSGNGAAIRHTVAAARRGGRIVLIGLPSVDDIPLNVPQIIDNEIDVRGVFRYANTYETAIRALGSAPCDIRTIITHRFPLEQIKEAMELARLEKQSCVKVMIYPGEMTE
ncbi:NAD(P)-dependent alcohol dehydrogenase [Paenibacillus thalictri]|uniref:NAD(P)-dependent alcohol dehydrogenase n=1 Tax=Paenibacillus thalictri TaxID=2527873 RepID=A0A4Q9DPX8_9BACL|nr:NAD(P)-dependent alcohol dehydrogenase [Paenibacillus thalictri]TBL77663.1 NAD(P)-dependent alcohol dehydrogenase [Paenibacillus thalictri]